MAQAIETMHRAVDKLATGSEPLKVRLGKAAADLGALTASDFALGLQEEWTQLQRELTLRGSIPETLQSLDDWGASLIARRIVDLQRDVLIAEAGSREA